MKKWKELVIVYLIEDDKYGTQAVLFNEEEAERRLRDNPGKWLPSGSGVVVPWEVE